VPKTRSPLTRFSLKVTEQLLLLDLGEVRRVRSQDGPCLVRYLAVVRQGSPLGPLLAREGVVPALALLYVLPVDLLEFGFDAGGLSLPGLRFYADEPEFVETPLYAWLEG
jgi:hypothetical protein